MHRAEQLVRDRLFASLLDRMRDRLVAGVTADARRERQVLECIAAEPIPDRAALDTLVHVAAKGRRERDLMPTVLVTFRAVERDPTVGGRAGVIVSTSPLRVAVNQAMAPTVTQNGISSSSPLGSSTRLSRGFIRVIQRASSSR